MNNSELVDGEISDLPDDWEIAKLGELITYRKGKKPKVLLVNLKDGAIPYLTADYFRTKAAKQYVPAEEVTKNYECNESDVVLIWDGSKSGDVFTGLRGILASTMVKIQPASSRLIPPLLFYYLKTKFDVLNSNTTGSTIPHINRRVLDNLLVPLPPLPEQKAISHILSTVQRAKEATEQVIQATKELKKNLMKHLFTYGPVSLDDSLNVKLKETEIGMVPEGWNSCTLEQVKANEKGSIVSGPFGSNIGKKFFKESGIPLIRGNNLTKGEKYFLDSGFVYISEQKAYELKNCEALLDDLVFTAAGTVGQVGLINDNCKFPKYIISNKQLRVRLDKTKVNPRFMFYWFVQERMYRLINIKKRGSSIPVINLGILRNLPVSFPAKEEQNTITEILSRLDNKIFSELNKKSFLETLFATLLNDLMTGKIRVNNIKTS